jgi:hypothetical protein
MNKKTNVKNDCRSYRDAGGAVRGASARIVRTCTYMFFFIIINTVFHKSRTVRVRQRSREIAVPSLGSACGGGQ